MPNFCGNVSTHFREVVFLLEETKMRCIVYYEPFGKTRQEKREGHISRRRFLLNGGFAYDNIAFAKEEMRDFVKHLRREDWKTQGSMRRGYYEAFRGKKHRVVRLYSMD